MKTLLAGVMVLSSFAAWCQITLKIQSSDNFGDLNFKVQQQWAQRVKEQTGGQVLIEMMPTGSVVKHTETMDAIKLGIVDGQSTTSSYFSGKDAAFGLIGNMVGAWSSAEQMLDYMNNGGGNELLRALYKPYGIYFVGPYATGVESLVSKKPLNSVADLKGLKLRAPEGLVSKIFAAAEAAPVNIPNSEVYTALSKGVIDASDYQVFSTNQAAGLNDIAPNPVYPGFHSCPLGEISISLKKWQAMTPDQQKILTESVDWLAKTMLQTLKVADVKALAKARKNPEIHLHDWSQQERKKFRKIARNEWKVFAKRSANAQRVYDSITAYLKAKGLL